MRREGPPPEPTMQIAVKNSAGEVVDQIEVSDYVFGIEPNEAVVHQALVRQLANARQGTAKVKTRGEVAGGAAKIRRQKGTGRSRQGGVRSPLHRGGGITFGPQPRDYRQAMPKKMRRLALRSILSARTRDGQLTVVDGISIAEPRTKEMARILSALGVDGEKALLVTESSDPMVVRSARNLARVKTLPAPLLNVRDLLSHDRLVMTVGAVRRVEQIWAQRER